MSDERHQSDSERPRFVRIDLDDPAQLKRLTLSGAIWTLPTHAQLAVDAIASGAIPLEECQNVPEDIAAFLSSYGTPASIAPRMVPAPSSGPATPVPAPAATQTAWVCPVHGVSDVRAHTGPSGRVYGACHVGRCQEFERAPGKENLMVSDVLSKSWF